MISYVFNQRTILKYDVGGYKGTIPYVTVKPYWHYSNKSDLGDDCWIASTTIYKQRYLVTSLTIANGQGGIVIVWDMQEKKLVHVSNGSYGEFPFLLDDKVFLIRGVEYWGCEYHNDVVYSQFGTLDAWKECEVASYDVRLDENNMSSIFVIDSGDSVTQVKMTAIEDKGSFLGNTYEFI